MERRDNYHIQAQQAKARFLTYDQQRLREKFGLEGDENYLYLTLLNQPYRINRTTGDMDRYSAGEWMDGNSYNEVMTILDLLCDSREDRHPGGEWKSMQSFGLMFHQNLLEEDRDPWANRFQQDTEGWCRACMALGGRRIRGGDHAYEWEFFDGLKLALQFWAGDEEFAPRLRWLWDQNANQYLRYETMYFAVSLTLGLLKEHMT